LLGILAGLYIRKKHRKNALSPTEAIEAKDTKYPMTAQDATPRYEAGELPEHAGRVELPTTAPNALHELPGHQGKP
jgi:hypothetical protein